MHGVTSKESSPLVEGGENYLELAHEDWLKEKKRVLEGLDYLLRGYKYTLEDAMKILDAIEFIEGGES